MQQQIFTLWREARQQSAINEKPVEIQKTFSKAKIAVKNLLLVCQKSDY